MAKRLDEELSELENLKNDGISADQKKILENLRRDNKTIIYTGGTWIKWVNYRI